MKKNVKHTILCIDDDKEFLDSMRLIIEGAGFRMEAAHTAEDGLEKYKTAKPNLVIVDLMMEEIDSGVNFVKDLKALGPTPPIFMLSSVGDTMNVNVDFSQLGLTGILQKPINPDQLVATLKAKLA